MNHSEQILKERFEQLPKDVKEAITTTPWKEKLRQISEKHNLHIDQAGHLGEETAIVMFGLEHPKNLVENIVKNVEVSKEKAKAITEDLNREIFLKVRESLKKIFEEKNEQMEEKSTETEEMLNREDILREIEDNEHHNLPTANKQELHLETPLPREIVNLETKHPNKEKPVKINPVVNKAVNQGESEKKRQIFERLNRTEEQKDVTAHLETKFPSGEDAIKTMPKDIVKAKMDGTMSVPKETIEINDSMSPIKKPPSEVGNKTDPYREQV